MSSPPDEKGPLVLTASLTSGVARVTHGMRDSIALVEEILALNHTIWESTLSVGDEEYYQGRDGPFPNHQMRVSVLPNVDAAALNYMRNDVPKVPYVNSYNPHSSDIRVDLIFNGRTGRIFPRWAVISVGDARLALHEWLQTRRLPTCIEWRPYRIDENL